MMTIEQKFWVFHFDNPQVYQWLVFYARQAKGAGFDQYSINGIFERMRWHLSIETKSKDGFKLSNNHRSRYSRLIMDQEKDLAGFFEIRDLKTP